MIQNLPSQELVEAGQSSSLPFAAWLIFIALILVGAILVAAAASNYKNVVSNWYESNKGRKTGLVAMANSPTSYRVVVGVSGALAMTIGLVVIIVAG